MRTMLFALLLSAAIVSAQRQLVPVPEDPHELAKGQIQVLSTREDRAAIVSLMDRAAVNFAFHLRAGAPYSFKASFTATGPWSEQGQGAIEELWANGQQWRWSQSLGSYSQLRIFSKGIAYDDKQVDMAMPLLLLRTAIFNPVHSIGANMQIRSVNAAFNGVELTCGLFTNGSIEPATVATRRWAEREYCADPKTNLLYIYSDAPGLYVVYDYTTSSQFHGRAIPGKLAVYENSQKVIEAQLSIADLPTGTQFTPTPQMIAGGPGAIMTGLEHFTRLLPATSESDRVQPIMVHAVMDSTGSVKEAIALQPNGDAAVQAVKQMNFGPSSLPGQIARQRQALINVQFVPGLQQHADALSREQLREPDKPRE